MPRAALCALLAAPAGAAELDRGDLRMEIGAELRSLYTFTRRLDLEDFQGGSTQRSDSWLLLQRVRFDFEATWRDQLFAEVVYDVEGRTGTGLDSLAFAVGEEIGTRTWLDADRVFADHESFHGMHLLYRGWLRYEGDSFDVTVGRQRIPLGRARLWNPTDLFNPIFPLAIQGDQRIGQDALLARWEPLRSFWVMGIWAPQDDPDEHRAALRLELVRTWLDAALMVGRFQKDWVFGFDFARNLGGAAIRGEATLTDLEAGERHWQAVGSLDYSFAVGNGLYTLVEHLYNEHLLPDAPPGLPVVPTVAQIAAQQVGLLDRITTVSRNQTGFQLGYEWSPLWRTDLLWLYDWEGASLAVVPVLALSPVDDVQLAFGAQLFLGTDDTEYGDAANLFFAQLDIYF